MPRTACLVVCGRDDAMAIFVPTRALVSVDLPALGLPTKQAKPDRNPAAGVPGPPPESATVTSGLDPVAGDTVRVDDPDGHATTGDLTDQGELEVRWAVLGDKRYSLEPGCARRDRHRHRQLDGRQGQGSKPDARGGVRPAVPVSDACPLVRAGASAGRPGQCDGLEGLAHEAFFPAFSSSVLCRETSSPSARAILVAASTLRESVGAS